MSLNPDIKKLCDKSLEKLYHEAVSQNIIFVGVI